MPGSKSTSQQKIRNDIIWLKQNPEMVRRSKMLVQTDISLREVPPEYIKITIAIIGSRKFHDYAYLKDMCDILVDDLTLRANKMNVGVSFKIISGGANGADKLAEVYARFKHYEFEEYLPLFKKELQRPYIVGDYFTRNVDMAEDANVVIGFLIKGDENKGSRHMIKSSLDRDKEVHVFWRLKK